MDRVETFLKWGGGLVAALALLILSLRLTLGEDNFLLVMWWLILAVAGAAVLGLIYLAWRFVTWRDRKRDELHQAWYMQGAMVGVDVIRAALESEADRQMAMAKFGVEVVKVLKSTGALESGQPPLFLGMPEESIEGDYNVIHGLDDNTLDQTRFDEEITH